MTFLVFYAIIYGYLFFLSSQPNRSKGAHGQVNRNQAPTVTIVGGVQLKQRWRAFDGQSAPSAELHENALYRLGRNRRCHRYRGLCALVGPAAP